MGYKVEISHFFKPAYAAKSSSTPSTSPCVCMVMHTVNQLAALIQVEI